MIYRPGTSIEVRGSQKYLRSSSYDHDRPELVTTFRTLSERTFEGSSTYVTGAVVDLMTLREPVPVPPGRLQKRWQGGRWEQLTRKGWVAA